MWGLSPSLVQSGVAYMMWSGCMSISSLPSLAAVVPGPEHGTMGPINWWFCDQLLPLHPPPHSTTGGSRVHARALKCCSALHCSGLQHLPVFPCDSLFSLVLMAPPGLVSSAGLHSHTSLLVGHPGGNKVKAVLKASRSARSSSLLCAPLSSASSVPINLVISRTGRWEQLDGWTLSEAEAGAGSRMWEGPAVSPGWAGRPGQLHGEHHKGKVILLWKKAQVPWKGNIGDGNLCIHQQKRHLFRRRHSKSHLWITEYLADKRCHFDFLKLAAGTEIFYLQALQIQRKCYFTRRLYASMEIGMFFQECICLWG